MGIQATTCFIRKIIYIILLRVFNRDNERKRTRERELKKENEIKRTREREKGKIKEH